MASLVPLKEYPTSFSRCFDSHVCRFALIIATPHCFASKHSTLHPDLTFPFSLLSNSLYAAPSMSIFARHSQDKTTHILHTPPFTLHIVLFGLPSLFPSFEYHLKCMFMKIVSYCDSMIALKFFAYIIVSTRTGLYGTLALATGPKDPLVHHVS